MDMAEAGFYHGNVPFKFARKKVSKFTFSIKNMGQLRQKGELDHGQKEVGPQILGQVSNSDINPIITLKPRRTLRKLNLCQCQGQRANLSQIG